MRRSFAERVPMRKAVDAAFTSAGLVQSATSKAWLLATTAETLVGFAYEGGYLNGWYRPAVREVLTGFAYSSVLDSKTTPICVAYDGVQLPVDDVWWRYHWPKNHWGCRACVMPRFDKFKPTENPPWAPPPMDGFGVMPAISAAIRVQTAAA